MKARQALLHAINQKDFMQATFANAKYTRTCGSLFACGTPMRTTQYGVVQGRAEPRPRRQLLQESGYDGRPIVILQATTIAFMNNSAQLIAQALRQIGANVQLAAADWGGIVQRRANKGAPDQGGWNIFITWASGSNVGNPISLAGHAAVGDKGLVRLAGGTRVTRSCATPGRRPPPSTPARPWRARCRRTPGTSCPMPISASGCSRRLPRQREGRDRRCPELLPFWNIEKV